MGRGAAGDDRRRARSCWCRPTVCRSPVGNRIARVLDDIADALEQLVADVIALMNQGATLDTIIHTVSVPADTLAKPYLRPLYDEPEFVIRNIWRQFGGWWDGAASRLKPAPDAHVATAIAELCGGPASLINRAQQAVADNDLRLACHLADFAGWAAPDDPAIHAAAPADLPRSPQRRTESDEQGDLHGRGTRIATSRRVVSFLARRGPARSPRTPGRRPGSC